MSLSLFLFTFSATSKAMDLTVNVHNIKPDQGALVIELMTENTFENELDNSANTIKVAVSRTSASYQFSSIEPGEYAVFVYQDINQNSELDFSIFSGAEEPVGTSNNISFNLIPPSWKEVKIHMGNMDREINITLSEE